MKVTFVSSTGERTEVEAAGGRSLVELAIEAGLDEIEAECGGACSCATCHVLIAQEWMAKVPPARMSENDMLEILEDRRQPNSRLACQVMTSDDLDGLVVYTPAEQG
jgi:2Fe-2S ferredoxin